MNLKNILVAALLIVSVGVAGLAVAEVATFHDQTYEVDENTTMVFVDIEDTGGQDVTVEFFGVDAEGTETLEHDAVVSAGTDEVVSEELEEIDADAYDQYRVHVEGEGTEPVSISSGIEDGTSDDGAGFDLSEERFGVPTWILLLVGISFVGVFMNRNNNNGGH